MNTEQEMHKANMILKEVVKAPQGKGMWYM